MSPNVNVTPFRSLSLAASNKIWNRISLGSSLMCILVLVTERCLTNETRRSDKVDGEGELQRCWKPSGLYVVGVQTVPDSVGLPFYPRLFHLAINLRSKPPRP